MKKLFGLVAFIALAAVMQANAETVKLVSWAVDESTQNSDTTKIKPWIEANGFDLGLFEHTKASSYFINADFKVGTSNYVVHCYEYATRNNKYVMHQDGYTLLNNPLDDPFKSLDNETAVFENVNGDVVVFVNLRGYTAKNMADSGAYLDAVTSSYPGAWVFVTCNQYVSTSVADAMGEYLAGTKGYACLGSGYVGGFYAPNADKMLNYSVGDAIAANASRTGLVCSATLPARYRVMFQDWDETVLQSDIVEENGSVTPPADPEREGFVFIGWSSPPEELANVTKRITATAQYEQSATGHLVTYLGWDETLIDEKAVEDGEKAEAIACPERAGYESLGWFKDGEPYDFNLPVTDNITLVATYRLIACYEVGTAEELVNALSIRLQPSVVCAMTNDIDLADSGYVAADFDAVFEGNGYSITGLGDNQSLFAKVSGTIRNLRIRNVDIKMSDYERGILGSQAVGARIENVTFENCKITGARTNAGFGLFFASTTSGELDVSTVISNCVARNCHALITNAGLQGIRCGGFVSSAGGQTHIVDCLFLSDNPDEVTVGGAGAMGAGSFACESVGTGMIIERCLSEGKVYAPRCYGNSSGAGGIVGGASGLCRIYDCTNRATVVGALQNGNGGIVGRGCKAPVRIYRSVNYGSVTTDPYSLGTNPVAIGAGGILGGCWGGNAGVTIVDCANFGAVSTTTNNVPAGGVIGSLSGQATCVSNCMNYASVFAPTNAAGGVIGNAVSSSFSIYNTGNAGDVSCPLGSVGGVIGKNEFLNNNVHDYVYGFMQCGTVSTDSGYAGEIVGLRVGAQNSGCSLAVKNGVLAGSVVAGDGGRTGLLVAGTSPFGTGGEVTYSVDESTHVLDTTLVHYYNKSDEPCSFVDPLLTMTAADLKRKSGAAKWLDDYAMANGHVRWVQTENYPELSMFAQGVVPEPAHGLILLFR